MRKCIEQSRFKAHLHVKKASDARKKKIIDTRTGVEYWGVKEAARSLNLNINSVSKTLCGEKKTYPFLRYA